MLDGVVLLTSATYTSVAPRPSRGIRRQVCKFALHLALNFAFALRLLHVPLLHRQTATTLVLPCQSENLTTALQSPPTYANTAGKQLQQTSLATALAGLPCITTIALHFHK